eukprot:Pgem_evm1s19807
MFSVFALATFALAATTATNASPIISSQEDSLATTSISSSEEDSLAKCNKQFDMVLEKKKCFFIPTNERKKECLLTQMKLDKKCISYVESLGRLAELEPPLQKCIAESDEGKNDVILRRYSDSIKTPSQLREVLLLLNFTNNNCVDILVDFNGCGQQFFTVVEEEKKCFFEDDEKKRQCLKQMGLDDPCISDLEAMGLFDDLEPA